MDVGHALQAGLLVLSLLPPRGPRLLAQGHLGRGTKLHRNRSRRTGKEPLCQLAASAARTEGGGGEARGPRLGQPVRRSRENVPGGEWAGDLPALEGEGGLGPGPSVCCQSHPAP